MEVEAEFVADIRIRELLVGQLDGKADGFSAGFVRPAIGGFHDAGAAAGTNDEATRARAEGQSPSGKPVRKLTRFFVIAGHFERAFGVAQGDEMVLLLGFRHIAGFHFFEPRVARRSGLVGFDACRTEHDDGVADTFLFELR